MANSTFFKNATALLFVFSCFNLFSQEKEKNTTPSTSSQANGNTIDICSVLPTLNSSNSICYTGDFSFSTSTSGNYNYVGGPQTNFGCLYTSPNQTWFVITVTSLTNNNHTLNFSFPNNNSYDIDAAIWGPIYQNNLANACASLYNAPITCDYDTQDPNLTISNAEIGQKYLLVITNYENLSNVLQITQPTGGQVEYCTPKCPVMPTPTILATSNSIVCGQSVGLSATGCINSTAAWSNGSTGNSITVYPTQNTTYTATCSNNGCISNNSNTQIVSIQNLTTPTISTSASTISCGQTTTLMASNCSGGTIIWSTGATGTSISVSPTIKTSYTAQCKVGNCLSLSSNSITINLSNVLVPSINATASTITCGESTTLTASSCSGTITWSNGSTATSISVSPSSTTIYRATCKINTCISNEATKLITVNALPTLTIAATSTSISCGQSTTLTALGSCSGTIKWSSGVSGVTITVSPRATTIYKAVCLTSRCFSNESNSVTINVSGVSAPTISATSTNLSCGQSTTLTASNCAGGVVKWSDGSVGTSIVITPYVNTSYTATCTNVCTSAKSNTINLTVSSSVSAPIISSSNTNITCGQSVTLTASNCSGIVSWSNGATGSSITVTPNVNSTYTAICTLNGCVSPLSSVLTINITNSPTAPTISTSQSTNITCGQTVTLTASSCTIGSIVWSNGSTLSSITVSPTSTTSYSARCTNGSCSSLNSNTITVSILTDTDNSVQTATAVSIPFTSGTLALCPTSDTDWFKTTIYNRDYYIKVSPFSSSMTGLYLLTINSTNGIIEVETKPVNGSTTDTYLRLYDATGTTLLKSDDDSGVGFFSKIMYCPTTLTLTHSLDDYTSTTTPTPIIQQVSSISGKIIATNFITGTNTNVSYFGKSIELRPGFITETGTVFLAQTGGCQ